METLNILTKYYSNYDEEGRLLSKHGQVEYLTTMRYIGKYLQPGMRILEVGSATGRYSHTLAQAGYQVDAVELVEHNIEIFRQKTIPGENVTIRQGDARNLSFYEDNTFDITLVLGPIPGLRLIPYRAVGNAGGFLLAKRFADVTIGDKKQSALVAFAGEGLGNDACCQALTGG